MSEKPQYDGSRYISDGDMLSFNGQVCARNADLLRNFDVTQDLGLDALDILDIEQRLVAFSTELDSPHGTFTAGDLLFTNGAVIPNAALMLRFQISHDVGLDGVHFVQAEGDINRLVEFAKLAQTIPRDGWLNGRLQEMLQSLDIDIWFSIEGTGPIARDIVRPILDGDVLSARTGTIVLSQFQILAPPIPGGIPPRGVDFGLDALAGLRTPDRSSLLWSTEILYRGGRDQGLPGFTDGEILAVGGNVVQTNDNLVNPFLPAADFLGLDALSMPAFPEGGPLIESMCGDNHSVLDFDGGLVYYGDPGSYTGLYRANTFLNQPNPGDEPRYACGDFVPVEGSLPPLSTGLTRFRVAYREDGTPTPAVGTGPAIQTQWFLSKAQFQFIWPVGFIKVCPTPDPTNPSTYHLLETDSDGWMDAADYVAAEDGTLTGCEHDLKLGVWNTNNYQQGGTPPYPPGPADPDGHYILWLEYEDSGGLNHELVEHHLQLDNTAPTIAPLPDGLQIRLTDGTVVPMCEVDNPVTDAELEVWGQFEDEHYWNFTLILKGGMGGQVVYGPHNYFDPTDGPPGLKNTDDTGTMPDATTVHLRNIFMTDLGAQYVKCCYLLDLWVYDAVFRHSFDRITPTFFAPYHASNTWITFAASP